MKLVIWLEREQLDEKLRFAPGEAAFVNSLTIHHHAKMTQEMNLQRGRCCRLFLSRSRHLIDSTVQPVSEAKRTVPGTQNEKQKCDVRSVPSVTDTKGSTLAFSQRHKPDA